MQRISLPYKFKNRSFVFLCLALALSFFSNGQDVKVLFQINEGAPYSIDEAVSSSAFEATENMSLNFQNVTGELWVKIELDSVETDSYLILSNPLIDSICYYQYVDNRAVDTIYAGDFYLFKERSITHPKFIFPISPSNKSISIFLRLKSEDQLFVPIEIKSKEELTETLSSFNLIKGVYFGIVIVMFLYNLFIGLTTKEKSYNLYAAYIFFIGSAQASLEGYLFQYIFPNSPILFNHSIIATSAMGGISALLFTKEFLQVKKYAPKWIAGLNVFIGVYMAALVFDLMGFKSISNNLLNTGGLTVGIYALSVAGVIAKQKFRPAYFFLIAWSFFMALLIVYVLRNLNVVDGNVFTNNSFMIGSAIQIVLLSIALADRINVLRREKEESQADALRVSLENEKIIKEQNVMLEQRVDERTMELQETNEELTVTLTNLRETQSQLVDAEKMASLGQLTAGIAHEINNPINFVTSNIGPLKRDLEDVYELIDAYDKIEDGQPNTIDEARRVKKDIDYDFVKEEIDTLVNGISDGAERTSEIVKGLRNFSRLDEDALKVADIHEGLDSTLVILKSKMGSEINVVKDFDKDLPLVECFPGKLNQVFMNILNNGIYAVQTKVYERGKRPTITLKTRQENNAVVITLSDNGVGMDEQTKNKIFDPFFTTKDVGEGTGLGMSIVYKIMDKHRGTMNVESTVGKGSDFIITLPLRQPNNFE